MISLARTFHLGVNLSLYFRETKQILEGPTSNTRNYKLSDPGTTLRLNTKEAGNGPQVQADQCRQLLGVSALRRIPLATIRFLLDRFSPNAPRTQLSVGQEENIHGENLSFSSPDHRPTLILSLASCATYFRNPVLHGILVI